MKKGMFALLIIMTSLTTYAGELDDFEAKAKKSGSSESKEKSDSNKNSGTNKKTETNAKDKGSDGIYDIFAALAIDMIVGGGQSSFMKAQSFGASTPAAGPFFSVSPKLSGDRLIPFARFDYYGAEITSNVYAKDATLELGYGAFALYGKDSLFIERDSGDELTLRQWLIDYRMLLTNQFQLSIGTGKYQIRGNSKTTQDAAKAGLVMNLFNGLYFDYSYLKSKGSQFSIIDQEASFTYAFKNIGLKAGYRKVDTSGAKLTGPFAGFTLQF